MRKVIATDGESARGDCFFMYIGYNIELICKVKVRKI